MKTSYEFTHAIVRLPGQSVVNGLTQATETVTGSAPLPDPVQFAGQHEAYISTLQGLGLQVEILPSAEAYPDSVFVEDAALCIGNLAIALRPGAPSRSGEAALIRPALEASFSEVRDLPGAGNLDGGDVLVGEDTVFVGLSARTDKDGVKALQSILEPYGYQVREVNTPPSVLHFKTACGLLDDKTIFSTATLAQTGCFEDSDIVIAPEDEEAAANLVRINEAVLISAGASATRRLLEDRGYRVIEVENSEPAKIDGGLSCMSLRYNPSYNVTA